MSATLGDVTRIADDLTRRNGRETARGRRRRASGAADLHLRDDAAARDARGAGQRPSRRRCTSCTSPRRPRSSTRPRCSRRARAGIVQLGREERDAIAERIGAFRFGAGFGKTLSKLLRSGIGVHHAGMLPRYRRLVEQLAQAGAAAGHLRHRHPRRRHQRADPHRAVHGAGQVRRQPAAGAAHPGVPPDRRPRRAGPASTPPGYVVVQAPEHAIENERAKKKAEAKNAAMSPEKQAKQKSKAQLRKPPEGAVVWTEQTFDKLVSGEPEPLVSRMKVDNAMLINVAGPRGGRLPGAAPAAHRQPRGPPRRSCGWPGGRCGWPAAWCTPAR